MFGCVGVWVCRRMNASRPRLASITRTILLVLAGTFFIVLLEGAMWAAEGGVKTVNSELLTSRNYVCITGDS